jgi:hypothetical protein
MRQRALVDEGFETFCKPTRRQQFLEKMSLIIPWRDQCKVIKPGSVEKFRKRKINDALPV